MNYKWWGVLLGGTLWSSGVRAHDFRADKQVNGAKQVVVNSYPTTLTFSFSAENIHPTLPSELLSAVDPLMSGCTFSPSPPQTVPVGGKLTYECPYLVVSREACLALGVLDTNPSTPDTDVSFTNVFSVGWDSGSSQSGVNVRCDPEPILPCDDTVYFSTSSSTDKGLPAGPSRLYIFDPGTATLMLQGESALPYNALAFNHRNGFLYAIASDGVSPASFIRVDANGSAEVIAPVVSGADSTVLWGAGAILEDGTYLAFEISSNHMVHIDSTTGATLSDRGVGTPETLRVRDVAVNPLTGIVYGFNSATQRITTIDPTTGFFTDYLLPSLIDGVPSVGNSMVSAIFTSAGQLYFYGSTDEDTAVANTFYLADLVTGALTKVATGPNTQFGDGATCAFSQPPEEQSAPTRGRGFFGSSEKALNECLSQGPIRMGGLGQVRTVNAALGVLWANPAVAVDGSPRSELERLEVQVARELVTATCNERFFGTPMPENLHTLAVFAAPHQLLLQDLLGQLTAFNDSGVRVAVPLRKGIFSLDPMWGLENAEEPKF
ncbi:hypothetical protein LZ198_28655 [Myxococcus sp. K15C18031901]|uniref:DUF6923 family protein n=1 Tax=Myxococcus dinghuensis TaxID=2906761 RepID=UPI0020A7BFD7|nr:hypothetical protein [Myxococcus dinghuensis]MCP3102855.1 hypothetical protein [Myxococcus dinghuensis]